MQCSVCLSDDDVATLDSYAQAHNLPSRAAAVRPAICLLARWNLTLAYATAFDEWPMAEAQLWETATADGIKPA